MARTHRAHMSPTALKKRGGKQEDDREREKVRRLKSHKQERPNERAKLRKEYL